MELTQCARIFLEATSASVHQDTVETPLASARHVQDHRALVKLHTNSLATNVNWQDVSQTGIAHRTRRRALKSPVESAIVLVLLDTKRQQMEAALTWMSVTLDWPILADMEPLAPTLKDPSHAPAPVEPLAIHMLESANL